MSITDNIIEKLKEKLDRACDNGKIPDYERVLSVVAGGFIVDYSIKSALKNPLTAISGFTLGGALVVRRVTGKCAIKGAIEQNEDEFTHTVVEHRYFVK